MSFTTTARRRAPAWTRVDALPGLTRGSGINAAAEPGAVALAASRALKAAGWRLAFRRGPGLTWANPITRTVRASRWATRGPADKAAVLVHELVHAIQFGGPGASFWTRLARLFLYFASRRVRLAMEVEAKAHGALVRYLTTRQAAETAHQMARVAAAHVDSLTGWRVPYLTVGNEAEVTAWVWARLDELVRASRALGHWGDFVPFFDFVLTQDNRTDYSCVRYRPYQNNGEAEDDPDKARAVEREARVDSFVEQLAHRVKGGGK